MATHPFHLRALLGALLILLATLGASYLRPQGFAPVYMDEAPKKRAPEAQTLQLNQPAASAVPARLL